MSNIIEIALTEDLSSPWCARTSELIFSDNSITCQAQIISKDANPIVISGIDIVRALYHRIDPSTQLVTDHQDGDILLPGETLMTIKGLAKSLLIGERTALNFLTHSSAIATLTARFVKQVNGTGCKILDTRKTTPGLRQLEKYAVQCGGGVNHRMGLYDAIMIKDTHIDLIGNIAKVLKHIPDFTHQTVPVIFEVRSLEELDQVITHGENKISRILLDNMDPITLKKSCKLCDGLYSTEASGNINLDTIREIAETGVAFASVGMLTHSAGHVDLSMKTMR